MTFKINFTEKLTNFSLQIEHLETEIVFILKEYYDDY
jgi:hypothetical protein